MRTADELRSVLALTLTCAWLAAQEPKAQEPAKPQEPAKAMAAAPKTLALGSRAPAALALRDIDGKQYVAESFRGKIVVVNFFSTQCPVQRGWNPQLAALQTEFAAKGVNFLNIDSNRTEIGDQPPKVEGDKKPYEEIRTHLAEQKLPYTVLVDHGNVVADVFGAKTTPDIFVFGTDGRLVYRGLIADEGKGKGEPKQHLRDTLTKLVAGEKVEPFETKPAGCSIKRAAKPKADQPKDAGSEKTGGEKK